jgi:hypothetical protein
MRPIIRRICRAASMIAAAVALLAMLPDGDGPVAACVWLLAALWLRDIA